MKNFKLISSSKGLTLIEVLLSLTILSIILLSIMNFFNQAYSFTNLNQKKTAGINVARNALTYMEQASMEDSFLSIKNRIDKNSDTTGELFVCNNEYKVIWNTETNTSCTPIKINNIDYHVNIKPTIDENYSNFFIPLTVTVTWSVNNKEYSTSMEGAIKSEDLR
ncbi:prepilin-type N-terminal cleavage/methylation domain-containing protein [Niallia alba]|uniref:type IV pilus modification PilV family protein n=1 Tax=Niallia alba TaxID=2729105 RepID=UPI0039A1FEA7